MTEITESDDRVGLSTVVSAGDRRQSLEAMRDVLARDANDTTWEKHKAECKCVCGMADTRARVAIIKELRAVLTELATLPNAEEVDDLDRIAADVAADELAAKRANRRPAAASS